MPTVTAIPFDALADRLSAELDFSASAIRAMHDAVVAGHGNMAQFDHAEFGGSGQWMRGGMVMLSGRHDAALKRRVDRLCEALADVAADAVEPAPRDGRPAFAASRAGFQSQSQSGGVERPSRDDPATPVAATAWWPGALGVPATSGAQDGHRYAWFPERRRLAVERDGRVVVYDTGEHRIGGVAQQQGARTTLSFTSQHGPLALDDLPTIATADVAGGPATQASGDRSTAGPAAAPDPQRLARSDDRDDGAARDPFVALERLAELHRRGIVDDAEFAAKKRELLARI